MQSTGYDIILIPCHLDYASVIVLAVFIFAAASWMLSARKWFVGPLPNINVIEYKTS